MDTSAASDEQVFAIAEEGAAVLVTRDYHFTNPVRFPPANVGAILYIRHGNLTSEEEIKLVEHFLESNPPETYGGRLVTLYRHSARLR